jgi:hypothetical protein
MTLTDQTLCLDMMVVHPLQKPKVLMHPGMELMAMPSLINSRSNAKCIRSLLAQISNPSHLPDVPNRKRLYRIHQPGGSSHLISKVRFSYGTVVNIKSLEINAGIKVLKLD